MIVRASICVAVSLTILVASFAAADDVMQPQMRIYFLPFYVETYVALQRQDIERRSPYRLVIGRNARTPREPDHPLVAKLPTMLAAHPTMEKLQENHIRLKLVVGGKTYYVDRDGTVLETTSGQRYQLSKDEMERISEDIVSLRGVVDVDVCSGILCRSR